MKKIFFSIILITLATKFEYAFAQGSPVADEVIQNIIPPSPEAANLGKYGNLPLNMNAGTPQVSIPIYTIKGRQVFLPISLSYHGSGIKVDEVASWVGLGWTLNAGGVITRTVRGLPDESANGYFNRYDDYLSKTLENRDYETTDPDFAFWNKCVNGEYDLLPDFYYFNFGSYSGRIVFDENQQPVIVPYQDLKVEGSPTTGWTITTTDGNVYTFLNRDAEFTNSISDFYSSWYLSSISNANNNEHITFSYLSDAESQTSWQETTSLITTTVVEPINATENCVLPNNSSSDFEISIQHTKYLNEIGYKGMSIKFISETCRKDIAPGNNSRVLKFILIFNSSGELIRTFDFRYGYFGYDQPEVDEYINQNYTCNILDDNGLVDWDKRRLRLEYVQEVGKEPYFFRYQGPDMPSYDSYAKDHWGYYNGANNSSPIPVPDFDYEATHHTNSLLSANRNTNRTFVGACMLEEIIYPTKGLTNFFWEPHITCEIDTVDDYPFNTTLQVSAYSDEERHGEMKNYDLEVLEMIKRSDRTRIGGLPNIKTVFFSIKEPTSATFNVTELPPDDYAWPTQAVIYKLPLTTDENYFPFDYGATQTLPAGDYILVAMAAELLNDDVVVTAKLNVDIQYNSYVLVDKKYHGGMRIKKTVDNDGLGHSEDVVTEYYYVKDFDASKIGKSEGLYLNGYPVFSHPLGDLVPPVTGEVVTVESSLKLFYENQYFEPYLCGQIIASAYNKDPFGKNQGAYYGYDEVAVVKSDGSGGYSVFKYDNSQNLARRGNVLEEVHYDSEENKVKEISNTYSSNHFNNSSPGARIQIHSITTEIFDDAEFPRYWRFKSQSYNYNSSWVFLSQVKERIYDRANPVSFSEMETQNFYDGKVDYLSTPNEGHTQLTRTQEKILKTGADEYELKTTKYFYPQDYSTSIDIEMAQRFMKSTPKLKETWIDNKLIGSEKYNYDYFNGDNIELSSVDVYETNIPDLAADPQKFDEAITILKYDDFGNILTYESKDGITNSFIWGYSNQYPVAKVVNATYEDIEAVLGTGFLLGDGDNLSSAQRDLLKNDARFVNSVFTFYTYKPQIGILSVTDHNGKVMEYEYDGVGRLKNIVSVRPDGSKEIVEHYEYNYQE